MPTAQELYTLRQIARNNAETAPPVKTLGAAGTNTVTLMTFRAVRAGTGYSANDTIILRQIGTAAPQYYNATTNAVIGTPPLEDIVGVQVPSRATTSPTTSVASAITSTTLLALNVNRKYVAFRNDSTSIAYVSKSGTASTSSVSLLQPQGYMYFDDYTGVVTATWVTANGFMRIEEGV